MANNTDKVDFRQVSNQKCPDCGKFLKVNSVNKGHSLCWVCHNIRLGKKESYIKIWKDKDGNFLRGMTFLKKQEINRRKYQWTAV